MRIAGMPRRVLDLPSVPDLTPVWEVRGVCPGCDLCRSGSPRLRPIQSAALLEAEAAGGLLAPITVGGGKELLCLLLPDALESERSVILTRPRLRAQMLRVDIPRYGRHFRIPHGRFEVRSYHDLSDADKGGFLDKLKPDLIVANEAHCLKNTRSARTRKLRHYLEDHPETRFCALSGTMSTRSLRDYAHLAAWALRLGSPLPRSWRELDDWARALDSGGDPSEQPVGAGALLDLCGPEVLGEVTGALDEPEKLAMAFGKGAELADVERLVARRIYGRRLTETTGVVASSGAECDASLVISARRPVAPPEVREELSAVRRLWRLGEDDLASGVDVARVCRQLACGFYYRWVWPGGIKDLEWLAARSGWHGAVRDALDLGRRGLDQPLQVERAVRRGELRNRRYADALEAWDAVKDRPVPPVEAVWLSDFLMEDVTRWVGESDEPGIVWYDHLAVEAELVSRGLTVYGGGSSAVDLMADGSRVVAVSVHAHRDGVNLQRRSRALFITPFANWVGWEQAIGREHRSGQLADEVSVEVYQHDESLRSAWAQSMEDARAEREKHPGSSPRLLLATLVGFEDG